MPNLGVLVPEGHSAAPDAADQGANSKRKASKAPVLADLPGLIEGEVWMGFSTNEFELDWGGVGKALNWAPQIFRATRGASITATHHVAPRCSPPLHRWSYS